MTDKFMENNFPILSTEAKLKVNKLSLASLDESSSSINPCGCDTEEVNLSSHSAAYMR